MLEAAFRGGKRYWILLGVWGSLILMGLYAWSLQFTQGLTVTGMSQDVTWGIYIAQFTFLVGVAASAVMVVLPYYLHSHKDFGRMVILGEGLAIAAVIMCMLFIFVDMGQPTRVTNVLLHPTLNSMMFWDMMALGGYLALNVVIGMVTFDAEAKQAPPPKWIKPVIILSIPWAVSIHTVTAFLYSGLEARSFWMTAILAPRFLASAFSSGPSLLIILALILRRFTKFDPGEKAIRSLALIVAYAMVVNVFFVSVEFFTAIYSDMPHHVHSFEYLYLGLHGHDSLVPWMWTGAALTIICVTLLLIPKIRNNLKVLGFICAGVIAAIWIEKGVGMVVTGFVPNPLGRITDYSPSGVEVAVTVGVYAIGFMMLTLIYKIVVNVRERMLAA
ncbi:MAG: polysulfide reductase NrfD [Gemmatimonadetes bacterium]|nr:polysulfide reductase NrfD [Gemmatimonadota bacterium]